MEKLIKEIIIKYDRKYLAKFKDGTTLTFVFGAPIKHGRVFNPLGHISIAPTEYDIFVHENDVFVRNGILKMAGVEEIIEEKK